LVHKVTTHDRSRPTGPSEDDQGKTQRTLSWAATQQYIKKGNSQ